MKLDLSQWNPFKFFRKAPEEQAAPSTTATALAVPGEPEWPTSPEAMRRRMMDPWRLMQDMLRTPLRALASSTAGWRLWPAPLSAPPRCGRSGAQPVSDRGIARHGARGCGADGGRRRARAARREKVEAQTEEEGCYRLERAYGRFQRLIPLPDGVDVERVEATFAKGVLTIQVPKATEKPRGRRLQITSRARQVTGAASRPCLHARKATMP